MWPWNRSGSHEAFYFPIYLVGSFTVPNIGMVFVLAMQRSEENIFLGHGRWTAWSSNKFNNSSQWMISGVHLISFKKGTSLSPKSTHAYCPDPGFLKVLKISSNGHNRKDFPQFVEQQALCCSSFATPL